MVSNYLLLILVIFLTSWFFYNKYVRDQKINYLKSQNNGKQILFICTGVDSLSESLTQLYGLIDGGNVYPKINYLNINGNKYEINEVYADEDTPSKPSIVAPNFSTNIALVIKDNNLLFKKIKQEIKIHRALGILVTGN